MVQWWWIPITIVLTVGLQMYAFVVLAIWLGYRERRKNLKKLEAAKLSTVPVEFGTPFRVIKQDNEKG